MAEARAMVQSGGRGKRRFYWVGIAAGLALVLAVAPAAELLAQAPSPAGQPKQQGQPPSVDALISRWHQQLKITPAQDSAFNALATIVRSNAQAAQSQPAPGQNMTAVDGLRFTIQAMQIEVAGLQKLLPALEALYGTLSDQQKQTANKVFNQPPG
jgi:periplasmic protein CpxP/Spy